jgi:Spy/CpxP family protein refolding chaperone
MQFSRRQRGVAVGVALAAATLLGTQALARPDGRACGGKGGGPSLQRLEGKVDRLGLDETTRASVYQILDQSRSEQRALRTEIKAAHEQMRTLLAQDIPDLAAIENQADALGALRTSGQKAKLRSLVAIRGLLTAEQWQALQPKRWSGPPDADDRDA